jgi:large subunit ribosomal protein L24
MKALFSKSWKSSTQPRKQRKYAFNAPLHIRGKFLNVHLAKNLREAYGFRSIRVRKGDSVKIVRGEHKDKSGKVDKVSTQYTHVFVAGVGRTKADGTKKLSSIHPSNLIITELVTTDKRRFSEGAKEKKAPAKKQASKEN